MVVLPLAAMQLAATVKIAYAEILPCCETYDFKVGRTKLQAYRKVIFLRHMRNVWRKICPECGIHIAVGFYSIDYSHKILNPIYTTSINS